MESILEAVERDLANLSDAVTRETASRFFREPVRCRGVKTAAVHGVARQHWKAVAPLGKARVLGLCEDLYRTGFLRGRRRRGRLGRAALPGLRTR